MTLSLPSGPRTPVDIDMLRVTDDAASTLLSLAEAGGGLVRLSVNLPSRASALCPEYVTHVIPVPGAVPQRGRGGKNPRRAGPGAALLLADAAFLLYFLRRRSHSVSFTGAQGISMCKTGLGRGSMERLEQYWYGGFT